MNNLNKWLEDMNYFFVKELNNSRLYVNNKNAIIIDDNNICSKNFTYSSYTKEQNDIMFDYEKCYRFLINNKNDLIELKNNFKIFSSKDIDISENIRTYGSNRELSSIDPTNTELFLRMFLKMPMGERRYHF